MRYFLCILIPPVGVLSTGRIGAFILNLILTLCFWLPGVIDAILVINRYYQDQRHQELLNATRQTHQGININVTNTSNSKSL